MAADEPAYVRIKRWFEGPASNIPVRPSSASEIATLEDRYAVTLPEDFRQYLLYAQPAEENFDAETTSWWPVARIRNIPEEYGCAIQNPEIATKADKYLFFADHLTWCWAWAIACTDDENRGKVAVISSGDRFVADSFSEFVERYLCDWASVT